MHMELFVKRAIGLTKETINFLDVKVAIMHIKAHQKVSSELEEGN